MKDLQTLGSITSRKLVDADRVDWRSGAVTAVFASEPLDASALSARSITPAGAPAGPETSRARVQVTPDPKPVRVEKEPKPLKKTRGRRRTELSHSLKPRTCARAGCGNVFQVWPSEKKCYCTYSCYIKSRAEAAQVTCKQCGEQFRNPEPSRKRHYCSNRCQGLSERVARTLVCKICEAKFQGRRTGKRQPSTCSEPCRREACRRSKLGPLNPNFVGDNGKWSAWKASLERTCRRCGSDDRVQLHHVVYRQAVRRADGNEADARDSLTLCCRCHCGHHHGRKTGRVELGLLRDENYEFAVDLLGAGPAYEYLRRRYTGEDARLDALLDRLYPKKELA